MKEVFDQIAASWYNFRHRTIFKPELEDLARRWQKGKLLNVGCGHGPDFVPFRQGFELHGVDISPKMLEMAKKYAAKFDFHADLVEADARALPYPDDNFDYAISVAALHHIDTPEGRLQAFRELRRVLRPGGEAFITVWNRWQTRFWFKPKRIMVPWRSRSGTWYRYYYLFSFREVENMAEKAGFRVMSIAPEAGFKGRFRNLARNICLLVKKNC